MYRNPIETTDERRRKDSAERKECRKCKNSDDAMNSKEDLESWAFKTFREKAVADICSICFEDKPNIVTLCCGKSVHITCMIKWMSKKESCHHCRADMSSPPTPISHTPISYTPIHNDGESNWRMDSSTDSLSSYSLPRSARPTPISHTPASYSPTSSTRTMYYSDSDSDNDSTNGAVTNPELVWNRSTTYNSSFTLEERLGVFETFPSNSPPISRRHINRFRF